MSDLKEPTYKLKENHPTHQKVMQVQNLMEELGLYFYFGNECVVIKDGRSEYLLKNIDGEPFKELPFTEFKIIIP